MIADCKPWAGRDLDYSPAIPNGSVWMSHNTFSQYMVQWNGTNDDRCWFIMSLYYMPYHTNGHGGSSFCPYTLKDGQKLFSQEELAALFAKWKLERIDYHAEFVEARR